MKILLVDDDLFLCDMYAAKFSEKGHDVEQAHSVDGALAFLKDNDVDVVLLDMVMPGMTGIQLLDKMGETKEDKEKLPKFIVLSNQSEESDKKAALEAGALGYIVKAELMPSGVVEEVEKFMSAK